MNITAQIQKDIVAAMKAREELRLETLRMVKAALKNKEIDKRSALDEKEEMQVLSTLIKQRKDSAEQFTKGNRPELAAKELSEIKFIEAYLPKAIGIEEIEAAVRETISAMTAEKGAPTAKDMGTVMKNTMARFAGARVDGKLVSEAVKKALAG
ncbi:MAG: GatB/YqeY domain-containing protein [Acidobacteriota bacterium]|nr:GatB/YqeY domain-containing protein [Acidobacteriota bacterium]